MSYRLSLLPDEDGGLGLPGHGPDVRRRVAPRELGLEVPEPLLQLGLVRVGVRLGEVEVRPPVGRLEAPVARAVLRVGVRVADELLRGEEPLALQALDAPGRRVRVGLGEEDALAAAEALVLHLEGEHALGRVEARGARLGRVLLEQRGAEPLGVALGDQAALVGGEREDLEALQRLQLIGGARRAEDLQLVARLVDALQADRAEDGVQDLREAEPGLAADHVAADALAVQERVGQLAAAAVARAEHGNGLRGRAGGRGGVAVPVTGGLLLVVLGRPLEGSVWPDVGACRADRRSGAVRGRRQRVALLLLQLYVILKEAKQFLFQFCGLFSLRSTFTRLCLCPRLP